MPTYEYECSRCGLHFERQQSMKDAPIKECPECGEEVQRLVSGGSGFIMKSAGVSHARLAQELLSGRNRKNLLRRKPAMRGITLRRLKNEFKRF